MRHVLSSGVAAAVAVALVAAACGGSDGTSPSPSPTAVTSPSPSPTAVASASTTPSSQATDEPTPTPSSGGSAATGLRQLGEAHDLGEGAIHAGSPDGRSLLVSAIDPDDDSGALMCEGVPFEYLWLVDTASGDRRRALAGVAADEHPFVSDVEVSPRGDQILLIGSCEGFLGEVLLADLAPDGTITDPVPVSLPPGEWAGWTIHFTPEGDAITVTGQVGLGSEGAILYFLDSGEWLDVTTEPRTDLFFTPGDRLVEITDTQVVWTGVDGSELARVDGHEATASPDGGALVVASYDGGDLVLVSQTGVREVLEQGDGWGATFSPDGQVLSWLRSQEDGEPILVLYDRTDGRRFEIDDVGFGGATFLADGIAYTALMADPDRYWIARVRHRPWAQ